MKAGFHPYKMRLAHPALRLHLPRMSLPRRLLVLLLLGVGLLPAFAKDGPLPKGITRGPAPPESDLTTYYFGLITKGDNFNSYSAEDRAKIQAAHLANIERLAQIGKLLVAGPFADSGDWRGIFIFKCDSLEEAMALAASDPAVKAGRFRIEIHPWMTGKGAIRDPAFANPK
jgi:uncharacterized protein